MKIMRKVAIGLGAVVALVVIGVVVLLVSIDSIAKTGIERGGTYALGVKTSVDTVSIGIFSGKFGMTGLKVENPGGFKTKEFMSLGDGGVAVSMSSLQKPVVELPNLNLSHIRVSLEKANGKANYQTILDNLAKLKSQGSTSGSGSEKKFIVKELTITDVKVHLDLLGVGGDLTTLDVPIDKITMKNVGSDGSGVDAGQLTGIVVQAVLAAAVEKGGGIIPADVTGELTNALGKLDKLKDFGVQAAGEVTKHVEKLANEIGKQAEDAAEKLKKGIGDLIPGKK